MYLTLSTGALAVFHYNSFTKVITLANALDCGLVVNQIKQNLALRFKPLNLADLTTPPKTLIIIAIIIRVPMLS